MFLLRFPNALRINSTFSEHLEKTDGHQTVNGIQNDKGNAFPPYQGLFMEFSSLTVPHPTI